MRHISQLSIPVPAQGRQCGNSDGLSTGSSSGHGAKHCAAAPSLALLPLTPRHSAQHSVCFHVSHLQLSVTRYRLQTAGKEDLFSWQFQFFWKTPSSLKNKPRLYLLLLCTAHE